MRNIIIAFLSSCLVFPFSAATGQSVSQIPVISGEKWSGVFVGNSPIQPFGAPFRVNTAEFNGSGFCTPHLVSSAGRYIHGGGPMEIAFDGRKFTITSKNELTAQKGGRTLRQAYLAMHHRDFPATDRFPSPELFSSLVYETQTGFAFLQTGENIMAYADGLVEHGFPPGIMVLAEGWRAAPGYEFDTRYYPAPGSFISEMHESGFKVMLTVTPYIPAWGRDYAMLQEEGALVMDVDGEPLVMEGPEGYFAAIDLTSPVQAAGLRETLSGLQARYGVDGFRFDCLELVERIVSRPGFARDYLAAVREVGMDFELAEFWPGLPESRTDRTAGILSSQNTEATYLRDVITAGIAAGPFTQILPNVGNIGETAENKVARYAFMQVMMPVAHVPFAPWAYETYMEEMERVLKFRSSLARYMAGMYDQACKTLEPIVRPMEYNFPNSGFADCEDQFMIGDKYLIAPALDDNSKRLVRLPKGTWRDMSGRRLRGPQVLEAETDGYKMVWFELQ